MVWYESQSIIIFLFTFPIVSYILCCLKVIFWWFGRIYWWKFWWNTKISIFWRFWGCEVPAVWGSGGSCPHFWEVYGGQFFLNVYKDIKTDDIFQLSSKLVKKSWNCIEKSKMSLKYDEDAAISRMRFKIMSHPIVSMCGHLWSLYILSFIWFGWKL